MKERTTLLLSLLLWLSLLNVAWGQAALVSFPGRIGSLRGVISTFGFQFSDPSKAYTANLMLAAQDPFLCTYPENLEQAPLDVNTTSPIALLVRFGSCPYEDKLNIAVALQQKVTNDIRYVIMYNDNMFQPDQLLRLTSDSVNVGNLGVLFVTTRSGAIMLNTMRDWALRTSTSPFLTTTGSTQWDFPVQITLSDWNTAYTRSANSNAFYWLRFLLFGLLIMAPCFRALYLWCRGGGRIRFRRNEAGRVTGLQVVRPPHNWLLPSRGDDGYRGGHSSLLTEEQVMALPEITFVATARCSDDEDDDQDTNEVKEIAQESNENENAPSTSTPINCESPSTSLPPAAPDLEEGQGLETSCTTCSICIDDFEDGERIRLLPRCRHAFHTDCIMPWLTERQGSCPLCKTPVLETDDGDDSSVDEASTAQDNDDDTSSQVADEETPVVVGQDETTTSYRQSSVNPPV